MYLLQLVLGLIIALGSAVLIPTLGPAFLLGSIVGGAMIGNGLVKMLFS